MQYLERKMTRFESRKPKSKICKNSLRESVADTMLGLAVNFPLSWLVVHICLMFTSNSFVITFWTTGILTLTAIVRRYLTRVYFKNHETRSKK